MTSFPIFNNPSLLILVPVLAATAITDLRSQRIPNLLTLPTMLVALGYYTWVDGLSGSVFSLAGIITGIALLLPPYMMGRMGAGDAKLMGAVGAFVGAKGVFIAFLFTAIAGGIYALVLLIVKRHLFKGFLRSQWHKFNAFIRTRQYLPDTDPAGKKQPRLCYGVAISLGSISYLALNLSGYQLPI